MRHAFNYQPAPWVGPSCVQASNGSPKAPQKSLRSITQVFDEEKNDTTPIQSTRSQSPCPALLELSGPQTQGTPEELSQPGGAKEAWPRHVLWDLGGTLDRRGL